MRRILDGGAELAGIGSIAVKSPEDFVAILDEFGRERILLSADIRGRKIAVNAWQTTTGISLKDFLKMWTAFGVRQILCTDISRDGMLQGSAVELYRQIHIEFPEIRLIASGGVSSVKDFNELEASGCAGVIVGTAIYENRITLGEIEKYLKAVG